MIQLVVVGAGGHGREVLDVVEAINRVRPTYDFLGFLDDDDQEREALRRREVGVIGRVSDLAKLDAEYVIGIGEPESRRRIDVGATTDQRMPATLVHPSATIGSDVSMDRGCVISAGARLTTNVALGRHVHVNVNATISHDCHIGSYVTISPGANVSGNVAIDEDVFLGSSATIIQGVRIGAKSVIGAGAVVVGDLPARVTAVGIPARALETP